MWLDHLLSRESARGLGLEISRSVEDKNFVSNINITSFHYPAVKYLRYRGFYKCLYFAKGQSPSKTPGRSALKGVQEGQLPDGPAGSYIKK